MKKVFTGVLISLSQKGVELCRRTASCQQISPHYLELLSDIKLKLLSELKLATEEEHIYGKVIQQSNLDEHLFLLQFTLVFPNSDSNSQCTPSGWVRLEHQY